NEARPAECIRLYDVAAYAEKVRMNLANNIGTAQHQNFAAILLAPVIVEGRIPLLDVGAHGAVINDDAFFYELEKVGHWSLVIGRQSLVVRDSSPFSDVETGLAPSQFAAGDAASRRLYRKSEAFSLLKSVPLRKERTTND